MGKPDEIIRLLIKACNPEIIKQLLSVDRKISDVQRRITLSLTTANDAGSPWALHLWYEIQKLRSERTPLIDQLFSESGICSEDSKTLQGTAGETGVDASMNCDPHLQ